MPTPFESAQLLLTLYDQRREATMRKARDYFFTFDPRTTEDFMAGMSGPNSAYIRMVMSYWEMACSLVANGAIDAKMFHDGGGGEALMVYSKLEALLPHLREMFHNPDFLANLEKVILAKPNARQAIDATLARVRGMLAQQASAATN